MTSLASYLLGVTELETDEVLGVPVTVSLYAKGEGTPAPVILYVVGCRFERIGGEEDAVILSDMLDRGYTVAVVDYRGAEGTVSPALDRSVQAIRNRMNNEGFAMCGRPYTRDVFYIVPSGYTALLDIPYWSYDEHGVVGTMERIVEIWNNDFRSCKRDTLVHYPDGREARIGDIEAHSIYDCVKRDGSPIDLTLYMDIIMPVRPAAPVPIMLLSSSSQTRAGCWVMPARPHLSGFLFTGYAGVIIDYGYTPMARDDHYGYFDGNLCRGSFTGDNYTYAMGTYNGILNETAAVRMLRYLAREESERFPLDGEHIGVFGNSKGGLVTRLGEPMPERLPNLRFLPGHHGETRYEIGETEDDARGYIRGGKPQPYLTYSDGSPIRSNVEFVYTNCGGGAQQISRGHAPTYSTGAGKDGSYYAFFPRVVSACRTLDIPNLSVVLTELGHNIAQGGDSRYGTDTYDALFDMTDYYLKGKGAVIEYIAEEEGRIKIALSGGVSPAEMAKAEIVSESGDPVPYTMVSEYGNCLYYLDALLGGDTAYTVTLPNDILCENGQRVRKGKTAVFRTEATHLLPLPLSATLRAGSTLSFVAPAIAHGKPARLILKVAPGASNAVLVRNDAGDEVLVPITSAGLASADISRLLSEKAGTPLTLSLAHAPGEVRITDRDFRVMPNEGRAQLLTELIFSPLVACSYRDLGDGARILSIDRRRPGNNPFLPWVANEGMVCTFKSIFGQDPLSAKDTGRTFRIKLTIEDSYSRLLSLVLGKSGNMAEGVSDTRGLNYATYTEKGMQTIAFPYRIEDPAVDTLLEKGDLLLNMASTTEEMGDLPLFLHSLTVDEVFTDLEITAAALTLE